MIDATPLPAIPASATSCRDGNEPGGAQRSTVLRLERIGDDAFVTPFEAFSTGIAVEHRTCSPGESSVRTMLHAISRDLKALLLLQCGTDRASGHHDPNQFVAVIDRGAELPALRRSEERRVGKE